jgi:hypothetical protein
MIMEFTFIVGGGTDALNVFHGDFYVWERDGASRRLQSLSKFSTGQGSLQDLFKTDVLLQQNVFQGFF